MTKRKKIEKYSKRWYDKECMKLAKKIVHLRDKDICQKCLKKVSGSNCQCSHVFSDGRDTRLSVDPENMKILCYSCHFFWWHKQPLEATEWFKATFPERYESLSYKFANGEMGSISLAWREKTYQSLLSMLEQLEGQVA